MILSAPRRLALPVGTPLWGRLHLRTRRRYLKRNVLYGTLYLNCWYKVYFSEDGLIVSSAPKWMPDYPVSRLVRWDDVFARTSYAYLEDVAMALKPLVPLVDATRPTAQVLDPEFKKSYPVLYEHLCSVKFAGGNAREVSTLSIFTDGPLWKCFLNERNAKQSVCVTAATYSELLAVLEASIAGDAADWRARKRPEGSAGKKK